MSSRASRSKFTSRLFLVVDQCRATSRFARHDRFSPMLMIVDVWLSNVEFVFSWWKPRNLKFSLRVRHGEIRMVEDIHPAAHPRVNITPQPHRPKVRFHYESMLVRPIHSCEDIELVASSARAHIVIRWITVPEHHGFAFLHRRHSRRERITHLIHQRLRCRLSPWACAQRNAIGWQDIDDHALQPSRLPILLQEIVTNPRVIRPRFRNHPGERDPSFNLPGRRRLGACSY